VRLPVVGDGDVLGRGAAVLRRENRVPPLAPPVVRRPPDRAHVDDQRVVDPPLPRDPGVRAQEDVGRGIREPHSQLVIGQRLPQEVVDPERGAMDAEDLDAVDLLPQPDWQPAHPRRECGRRIRARVVVHELREVVVARVGVTATTVLVTASDGHVVVAGDAFDLVLDQQRPHCVALGAEPAEVAETDEPRAPALAGVVEHGP
jgi:hypothetical protein